MSDWLKIAVVCGSIGDRLGVFECEWIRGRQIKHALSCDRLMMVELYAASS